MQIVLAYSGGLDTSVLLKQYIEAGHDVVAMTANLGESDMVSGDGSQAALDGVRKKAIDLGAKDAVLIDARERFVEQYAYKALAANAQAISELGRELYDRIGTMTGHLGKVGSGLKRAVESYNDAVASLERRVLVSARKFRDLKASNNAEIEGVDTVDVAPRALASSTDLPEPPEELAPPPKLQTK